MNKSLSRDAPDIFFVREESANFEVTMSWRHKGTRSRASCYRMQSVYSVFKEFLFILVDL